MTLGLSAGKQPEPAEVAAVVLVLEDDELRRGQRPPVQEHGDEPDGDPLGVEPAEEGIAHAGDHRREAGHPRRPGRRRPEHDRLDRVGDHHVRGEAPDQRAQLPAAAPGRERVEAGPAKQHRHRGRPDRAQLGGDVRVDVGRRGENLVAALGHGGDQPAPEIDQRGRVGAEQQHFAPLLALSHRLGTHAFSSCPAISRPIRVVPQESSTPDDGSKGRRFRRTRGPASLAREDAYAPALASGGQAGRLVLLDRRRSPGPLDRSLRGRRRSRRGRARPCRMADPPPSQASRHLVHHRRLARDPADPGPALPRQDPRHRPLPLQCPDPCRRGRWRSTAIRSSSTICAASPVSRWAFTASTTCIPTRISPVEFVEQDRERMPGGARGGDRHLPQGRPPLRSGHDPARLERSAGPARRHGRRRPRLRRLGARHPDAGRYRGEGRT